MINRMGIQVARTWTLFRSGWYSKRNLYITWSKDPNKYSKTPKNLTKTSKTFQNTTFESQGRARASFDPPGDTHVFDTTVKENK